jgi:TonB family protein
MPIRIAVHVLVFTSMVCAQVAPTSVSPAEANTHLFERVEPTVPPLAKTLRIGGKVKLQITISTSGKVLAVKTISGHPIVVPSAIEAVKKWKYKPFNWKESLFRSSRMWNWTFRAGCLKRKVQCEISSSQLRMKVAI